MGSGDSEVPRDLSNGIVVLDVKKLTRRAG